MVNLFVDFNIGIGDQIYNRIFIDPIKNNYENIYVTHSKAGLAFWHNNNKDRLNFNSQLGKLLFSEKPYTFIPNPNSYFPFYPHERIARELNNKPAKVNFDCLCVGNSLGINNYIIITTKMRQFPKDVFEKYKEKIAIAFKSLAKKYNIIILGEREVEKTIEYEAECNRNQIFGIYDYLIETFKDEKIIDLTIPALGIIPSNITQFQQDCLIMREANAVITFGIGGNFWMATAVAKENINFRADTEWATDLLVNYEGLKSTKDINNFCDYLINF